MKFKLTLISVLLFVLTSLLYGYVFYKAEIVYLGEKNFYYQPYYYLVYSLFLFSILSLFLNRELLNNIILISISIIFACYLIEFYFHLSNFGKNSTDPMTSERRLLFYKELKEKDGVNIVAVPPQLFLNDNAPITPLSGHSNNKNFYCHKGQYNILNHDRFGFNNPDYVWDESNIDYLVVGDSNIYGACVKENQNINGYLRSISNKTALNIGQMSNGPLLEYATLKEYFKKKITKRIIWIYYEGNDLENLLSEKKIPILQKYLNEDNFTQNLISKQDLINELVIKKVDSIFEATINKKEKKIELVKLLKLYSTRQFIINYLFREKLPLDDFKQVMKKTKDFSNENNANLYFVYLPDHYRYINNKKGKYKLYDEVLSIVSELDIDIINLHEDLFSKIDALKYMDRNDRGYNHYNEKGNQVIADTIYNKIINFEK